MKEIVIEISDETYEQVLKCQKGLNHYLVLNVLGAIANGKVLPKGHGRLIDADTLADGFEDNYEFCEALNATPTLVEADKGEE